MPIPKYNELYMPLLSALADGLPHSTKETRQTVANAISLSDEELHALIPSGRQTVFSNRFSWAVTYLKNAGLIEVQQKYHLKLTKEGSDVLSSGVIVTNDFLASNYPAFVAFKNRKNGVSQTNNVSGSSTSTDEAEASETPQETFERVYHLINDQLSDEILAEIMNQTPAFFERLVVDLMKSMNYGEGFVTKQSHDDGIDGIIHEDKLGFNLIYIQAKRWSLSSTIGKPDIQKFAGAMMGPPKIEKGLFITTAAFSQGAKSYAEAQHIILVDGKKLAELMIEYGLGVSVERAYKIKKIDNDYFADI